MFQLADRRRQFAQRVLSENQLGQFRTLTDLEAETRQTVGIDLEDQQALLQPTNARRNRFETVGRQFEIGQRLEIADLFGKVSEFILGDIQTLQTFQLAEIDGQLR